jgi:hypothetical protein
MIVGGGVGDIRHLPTPLDLKKIEEKEIYQIKKIF